MKITWNNFHCIVTMNNGYFCFINLMGVMGKNLKGVFILDSAQS